MSYHGSVESRLPWKRIVRVPCERNRFKWQSMFRGFLRGRCNPSVEHAIWRTELNSPWRSSSVTRPDGNWSNAGSAPAHASRLAPRGPGPRFRMETLLFVTSAALDSDIRTISMKKAKAYRVTVYQTLVSARHSRLTLTQILFLDYLEDMYPVDTTLNHGPFVPTNLPGLLIIRT